jgi:hypothetical protein
MSPSSLYLGMVIAAFVIFGVVLFGVSAWLRLQK